MNISIILGNNPGSAVDGSTATIEDPPKHVGRNCKLDCFACKSDAGLGHVETRCPFKDLYYCYPFPNFQNLAPPFFTIGRPDSCEFAVTNTPYRFDEK